MKKTQLAQLEREHEEAVWAFLEVIDAHYGASYHHIGDGDGITLENADKIRALIARLLESRK